MFTELVLHTGLTLCLSLVLFSAPLRATFPDYSVIIISVLVFGGLCSILALKIFSLLVVRSRRFAKYVSVLVAVVNLVLFCGFGALGYLYIPVSIAFGQFTGFTIIPFFRGLVWIPSCVRTFLFLFNGEKAIRTFCEECGVSVSENPQDGVYDELDLSSCDINVVDSRMWKMWILKGQTGMGESYMKGWWTSDNLVDVITKLRTINSDTDLKNRFHLYNSYLMILGWMFHYFFNMQSPYCSKILARKHYDYSNEHFEQLLDPWMQYTCGYYGRGAKNVDDAQVAKLELIAEKIGLPSRRGMKVLDIGCGWGNLAKFFSERYGAEVVGVTLSSEQAAHAQHLNKNNSNVNILLTDYRDLDKTLKFDAITAIGVTEHIGVKNYSKYFKGICNMLTDDGVCLIQTIGSRTTSLMRSYTWIGSYIFPFGMLPSNVHLSHELEKQGAIIEDWHNFGYDYYRTLLGWISNLKEMRESHVEKHGLKSYLKWDYYLKICAGEFKSRRVQLWQIVFSKNGTKKGYKSIR